MPTANAGAQLKIVDHPGLFDATRRLQRFRDLLGFSKKSANQSHQCIPFSIEDVTIGVENELQTVVEGQACDVDLPSFIKASNYYKNILKRSQTGDASLSALQELEAYLDKNTGAIWENSWVNFPRDALSPYAHEVLNEDMKEDKAGSNNKKRSDAGKFFMIRKGSEYVRVPVSYALKLALRDVVSPSKTHHLITQIGEKLSAHYLNDNTSPETYSFYPVSSQNESSAGDGIAKETLKRFLLTQLLVVYANSKFKLKENGQRILVYFAPNTPTKQKRLNDMIPDAFYRELFMSPCLSGWDKGEDKHDYMSLCHQVLSRSQLNAVAKLKEAGILTNNLMILPNTSNTSLTNNGTHISLGSKRLGRLMRDKSSGFTEVDEKYFGDLGIKIMEHFLPLFIGNYSAAPYRMDFNDFHPEKALGFLPHELDYTHIRMIWRRWKKKADLKFFGRPLTPFGPVWLDSLISKSFGLKGDFITDFRLIDYLVCLMSTDESPALDGNLGNDKALKKDLADSGVFDNAMSLYLFCKPRQFKALAFSGFENRLYSQFASVKHDLGHAANLQQLITAYAYKMILSGRVKHPAIPDTPFTESERRQIIFGSAIGIPTFYVKINSRNEFLLSIVKQTQSTRRSRRYQGYLRVLKNEYLKALVQILKQEAKDLIEAMNMETTVSDLEDRINEPERASAAARLTRGISERANTRSPMALKSEEFNTAAEAYYREELRKKTLNEAFEMLNKDFKSMDSWHSWRQGAYNQPLLSLLKGKRPQDFLWSVKDQVISESVSVEDIKKLIHLTLLTIDKDMKTARE